MPDQSPFIHLPRGLGTRNVGFDVEEPCLRMDYVVLPWQMYGYRPRRPNHQMLIHGQVLPLRLLWTVRSPQNRYDVHYTWPGMWESTKISYSSLPILLPSNMFA